MAFTPLPRPTFGRPSGDSPHALPLAHQQPARTRASVRRTHEAKLAADLLPERPEPGESIHALMSGRYDLAQVIVATVRRWPVKSLTVATLSANRRTIREVVSEIDAGTVGTLTILVSGFFARHNKELFEAVRDEIRIDYPGSRIAAGKTHAKITLFEFRDGSAPLVLEGSANLRKNDSLEQLTAIRDAGLFAWHRQWINGIVEAYGQTQDHE